MSTALQSVTAPLGRLLLSLIFLMSGANKIYNWSQTVDQMEGEGMVAVGFFLVMAIILELGGSLSVLFGMKARLGAAALIVFLVPVTLIFHDFWQYKDEVRMEQMIHLMKNLAIMGGLLVVLTHGAGPVSFDARRRKQREAKQA